jgi:hypothetical protein
MNKVGASTTRMGRYVEEGSDKWRTQKFNFGYSNSKYEK